MGAELGGESSRDPQRVHYLVEALLPRAVLAGRILWGALPEVVFFGEERREVVPLPVRG